MELNSDLQTGPIRPQLKSYIYSHQYLTDYYQYRKLIDPQFSFEVWSAELGSKSRTYLRLLCQGRRNITSHFIESFALYENLNADEKEYLHLIAMYQKSRSLSEKKIYLDKIYEQYQDPVRIKNTVEIKNYVEFLSHRLMPLIKLIASFDDVEVTEKKLTKLLDCSLPYIKENLNLMEKMGLIYSVARESQSEKIWHSHDKSFNVDDKNQDEALRLFHQNTMTEAQHILKQNPIFQRFRSIYFSMSEEKFHEFTQETEKFLNRIAYKYGSTSLQGKYLFKLNLNSYPTTQKWE